MFRCEYSLFLSVSGLHRQHPVTRGTSTRTTEQNLLSADCSSEGQNHAWEAGITNEQERERGGEKAERGE